MSEVKANSFKEILKRSNKSIQADRATRISVRAKGAFDALVNAANERVMDIEDQLDSMSDISTSNTITTANAIKGATFDAVAFVQKRAKFRLNLALAKEELVTIKEDESFYN